MQNTMYCTYLFVVPFVSSPMFEGGSGGDNRKRPAIGEGLLPCRWPIGGLTAWEGKREQNMPKTQHLLSVGHVGLFCGLYRNNCDVEDSWTSSQAERMHVRVVNVVPKPLPTIGFFRDPGFLPAVLWQNWCKHFVVAHRAISTQMLPFPLFHQIYPGAPCVGWTHFEIWSGCFSRGCFWSSWSLPAMEHRCR